MIRDLLFRLRWWYRIKRGRCPMGPPPPCPDVEEFEIKGVYECYTPRPGETFEFVGWDNDLRVAQGLPPRGVDEPPKP